MKPQEVLQSAIELQVKKSQDYQSKHSTVQQADYYPSGIKTIYEIMNMKMLRIKSVMDSIEHNSEHEQNFESISDSVIDLINYASFMASYVHKGLEGQDVRKDAFNRYVERK